jgi:hypothetical protein
MMQIKLVEWSKVIGKIDQKAAIFFLPICFGLKNEPIEVEKPVKKIENKNTTSYNAALKMLKEKNRVILRKK